MKAVEIFLPVDAICQLESLHAIVLNSPSKGSGDSFGGLTRAVHWITTTDCAFISGWHEKNGPNDVETIRQNKKNNYEIRGMAMENKYGIIPAIGNYDGGIEKSFCIFNRFKDSSAFFNDIKAMSEKYDQISFLFKFANCKKAFYYYTSGPKKGTFEDAGELKLCSTRMTNYTHIGSGKITFE